MTNHDIVNKMSEIVAHLRMADTYSSSATAIDSIRQAQSIAYDIGEELGKTLTKEK